MKTLLILGILLLLVAPAHACGCGGMIEPDGYSLNVPQERVLLRWDGSTQDIVMELMVQGDAPDAALILPVPQRPNVQLADSALFDELHSLTKPEVKKQYRFFSIQGAGGGSMTASDGAAAGGAVQVLERQTLGAFDVSTLAASDANALVEWLDENGYQFPTEMAAYLETYVAENWVYVAVKLTPQAANQALEGNLEPIWVTFPSDELIYPMRLSALAQTALHVTTYVLAEHRVVAHFTRGDGQSTPAGARLLFADWLTAEDVASPLAPFLDQRYFLTRYGEIFYDPALIQGDYVFPFAPDDTVYRPVEYETIYVDVAGVGVGLWGIGLGASLMVGVLWRRFRR